jgi:hypothetical protein
MGHVELGRRCGWPQDWPDALDVRSPGGLVAPRRLSQLYLLEPAQSACLKPLKRGTAFFLVNFGEFHDRELRGHTGNFVLTRRNKSRACPKCKCVSLALLYALRAHAPADMTLLVPSTSDQLSALGHVPVGAWTLLPLHCVSKMVRLNLVRCPFGRTSRPVAGLSSRNVFLESSVSSWSLFVDVSA